MRNGNETNNSNSNGRGDGGGGGDHPVSYDLYAVSNHYGGYGSGHYTAYAMNRIDDEWYEFNDSWTKKITEEHVEGDNGAAYLLFYNQTEGPKQKRDMNKSNTTTAETCSFSNRNGKRNSTEKGNSSSFQSSDFDFAIPKKDTEEEENNDEDPYATPAVKKKAWSNRVPVIYQQSISRPEHWPHLQTYDDNDSYDSYIRHYKRPPTGGSMINVNSISSEDFELSGDTTTAMSSIDDNSKTFHFEKDASIC